MTDQYEGIVNPPIDSLLERVDSKYALVLFAAKRARQINAYYSQLHEGLFEYVGPLVETQLNEKPLSIAMREIESDVLVSTPVSESAPAEDLAAEDFGDFSLPGDDDPFVPEPTVEGVEREAYGAPVVMTDEDTVEDIISGADTADED
ncbi:DNA-directed RNA polymerase subunit omega [Micrococcus sp.]|uniref:DNA-directed RNA polymerase subunit omega n=1 Tax=Micrococcus sp. TaxID=1271 RepID=UPI002A910899|nr:DNA-directed RNA polymerase subunit omega [Micrococcus sp.]MDY6055457.1 DNA-directed RNA polymerase subunit omega [Micrococcus sp.]